MSRFAELFDTLAPGLLSQSSTTPTGVSVVVAADSRQQPRAQHEGGMRRCPSLWKAGSTADRCSERYPEPRTSPDACGCGG